MKKNSQAIFQLVEVMLDIPDDLFERALLHPESQAIKLSTFELSSEIQNTTPIVPLCQRAVRDVPEVIKMNKVMHALDIDLLDICFVFHVDSILSGENECDGLDRAYLIQYKINYHQLQMIQTNSFISFSSSILECQNHHASDYSSQVWSGIKNGKH